MPMHCCVPGCVKKGYSDDGNKVSYFMFSVEKGLRKKWIHAIRREEGKDFQPKYAQGILGRIILRKLSEANFSCNLELFHRCSHGRALLPENTKHRHTENAEKRVQRYSKQVKSPSQRNRVRVELKGSVEKGR